MSEDCIFCRIIKRKVPTQVIYEDDKVIVIPDKYPTTPGQTLIIPKKHVSYFVDVDDETFSHSMNISKKVAKASDTAFNSERTCLLIEGFEVPHVHIKLFPTYGEGLNIHEAKEASNEELINVAESIKKALRD